MKTILLILAFHLLGVIYQFLYIWYITRRRKQQEKVEKKMQPKVAVVVKGYIKDDGNVLKIREKR